MKLPISITVLLVAFLANPSLAQQTMTTEVESESINMPLSGKQFNGNADKPTRGMSMDKVRSLYGEPQKQHPAKGKPPITRWDYSQFSVYFESNSVIHSVLKANDEK